ncbi:MAG: ATP-grasp domain-containing protein [Candidatus Eremiobacteraeota bacterium]|nr:ATP-grasp domain-containing protein [Candidatus Eremiobacteraeota bacterium]
MDRTAPARRPAVTTQGVLILDGTPRTIVTISRSLQRRGIPAICAQFGRRGLGLHSNAILADIAIAAAADAFFADLKGVLRAYDVDTILPCSDTALTMLLPHYDDLRGLAGISLPQPDVVRQVLEKELTLAAARECKIPVPASYAIGDAQALRDLQDALRFPIIAKPARAGTSNPFKVKYFSNLRDLQDFFAGAEAGGENIFQEFFSGDGVGISTIVAEGEPLVLFQHRRLHEYPPAGGVGVLFQSEALDPQLAAAAAAILKYIGWHGPAMVEFRQDRRSGDYALMEINGRFWGSLPLAVYAGIDFPYLQWQLDHGIPPVVPKQYRVGLKVRWTAGEVQRFVELMGSRSLRRQLGYGWSAPVGQLAQSFDPRVRSALFSMRDPRPEAYEVASALNRTLGPKLWGLAKSLLPAAAIARLSQFRHLDPAYRKTYLWLWLARSLKLRPLLPSDFTTARRVTLVCRANRIRSPLAAAMLESKLKNVGDGSFAIRSAGTQADSDTSFDPRARTAAEALGLTLSGDPQKLTAEIVASSDILVVMDRIIEAELLTQFPRASKKLLLLGALAGGDARRAEEIADPDKSTEPEFSRFVGRLSTTIERAAKTLTG